MTRAWATCGKFENMADKEVGEGTEVEEISTAYTLDHFAEVEEVLTIIESVGTICHDSILMESAVERFTCELKANRDITVVRLSANPSQDYVVLERR